MELMDFHRAGAHGQQISGGDGEVRDDGVGGAVHDWSEWSGPSSNLQEIPCPELQGRCSQEDFNFLRREWLRYVRYYKKVDACKIRDQLWNCLDTDLQSFKYRDLGSNVDTATQAEMLG